MINFFFKLWKLNRPYKGRFFLGMFFGIINGFAQPMIYVAAVFVLSVLFTAHPATDFKTLGRKFPPGFPDGSMSWPLTSEFGWPPRPLAPSSGKLPS